MRASVIIPSYNSAATIRACLQSVLAQDLPDPYQVFVFDSGTDATAAIVEREFPSVRLLRAAQQTDPARGRNRAAAAATGQVLAFIDSDCIASPDWLRRLCTIVENGYDGAGGAIAPVDRSTNAAWAGYFTEFREFLPGGSPRPASYLTINNAAYSRDIFLRAGGFPEAYFPQEDQVFWTRLQPLGARIMMDPSIVVRHHHRSGAAAFLRHQHTIGVANGRVVLALGLRGAGLAAHPWLAALALPCLTSYRFLRTCQACWRQERSILVRRPQIAVLCWLGMWWWGAGFVRGALASRGERG
jgi:glycosyltransferase involved in cell wall biosynthesis